MPAYLYAKLMTISVVLVVLLSATAFGQSDAEKFADGRVALDKFKDCPAALKALESVSSEGRKNLE